MKTYDERTESILKGVRREKASRRKKGIAVLSSVCCVVLILSLVLFMPLEPLTADAPTADEKREYSAVIGALRPLVRRETPFRNLFEKWFGDLGVSKPESEVIVGTGSSWSDDDLYSDMEDGGTQPPPTAGDPGESSNGTYEEVTDNQVEGVIEGDLIKRSDRYIYYFANRILGVYSIAGEGSELVGSYVFESDYDKDVQLLFARGEMFLSADCRTVLLVTPCIRGLEGTVKRMDTAVISLDVSDPASIAECGRIYVTGTLRSVRMTNGSLLLLTDYNLYERDRIDFDEPETFIPGYTVNGEEMLVSEGQIIIPETCSKTAYTTAFLIDGDSMTVTSSAAVLSCTETVYVSQDKIFIAEGRSRREEPEKNTAVVMTATEIAVLSYGEGTLSCLGSVQVDGTVNNQYAMDEKDGVLRVVTSVLENRYTETKDEQNKVNSFVINRTERFGNLVCIDLSTFAVVGQVKGFAPGETVESVRFDGDRVYVCTAEVVVFTDPVFVFDLLDLSNITWKDTGTIDGYSTSLIQLPNGFLLGIGFGEKSGVMKLEIYVETENALVPITAYEREVSTFSSEYKSYLIDRENGYFGVPYTVMDKNYVYHGRFVLLQFNGDTLSMVQDLEAEGVIGSTRAVLIDGYLYLFSNGVDQIFSVTAVGK